MNLIQKESDLSKMRCSIPNKHLILIKLCKKDKSISHILYLSLWYAKEAHKVPLLDERCPCIAFFKGPRVTMASSALQGFIRCQSNVPRLYCIYIIPHKPKHNFKLFSFNNIISPILDYQLCLNQIVYLYTQVLLTPNTIHTITFLLNIL